ncbi:MULTISPECIES: Dabb family protein [Croceitalea]|uniref:Dabb family protein n=1 Tax=Croceitalea vernalis TaxID=3075599 RepID=A0ABU3BJ32_9FLAO|nr:MULTISPECIES: Dabb family protein [unclassified Croceitalea]MDT0540323.1 Dabb family protein [Croceitalea sp. P059]MDT0622158.1 Dabb family protein [Croceitalea sp. P007]
MKKFTFNLLLIGIIIMISSAFITNDNPKFTEFSENNYKQEADSLLRHVVLFKFKEDTSAEKLKEIETSFNALPSKIKEIKAYEWGLNNSPEGLNKGFTHCYFVTFKSEKDRAIYLPHPEHQAFVTIASPFIEDVTVVDYWTK